MTRTGIGRLSRLILTAGLATASVLSAGGAVSASPTPPHIVANPNNLMVNTNTKLAGTGFTPNTTLVLRECSRTSWLLPKQPCATTNKVTVTTSASGGFKATMKAVVCPKIKTTDARGFMETCFVGVPRVSKGSVTLIGAAKIIVTGP